MGRSNWAWYKLIIETSVSTCASFVVLVNFGLIRWPPLVALIIFCPFLLRRLLLCGIFSAVKLLEGTKLGPIQPQKRYRQWKMKWKCTVEYFLQDWPTRCQWLPYVRPWVIYITKINVYEFCYKVRYRKNYLSKILQVFLFMCFTWKISLRLVGQFGLARLVEESKSRQYEERKTRFWWEGSGPTVDW